MNKLLKTVLKAVITVSLLYWVITQIDFLQLQTALGQYEWGVVAFAFTFYFVGSITLNSSILLVGFTMPLKNLALLDNVNLVMRACSLFLPGYVVSAIRWKVYNRLGFSKANALRMMLLNRFHQLFTSSLLISILGYWALGVTAGQPNNQFPVWLTAVSMTGLSFLILLICCDPEGIFSSMVNKLGGWLRKWSTLLYADEIRIGVLRFLALLCLSAVSALVIVYCQYLLLSSVMEVTYWHVLLARSIVQILLILPISIGGLGVREAGFISVFSFFGYESSLVFAFTIVLLFYQLLLFMVGYGLYLKDKSIYTLKRGVPKNSA